MAALLIAGLSGAQAVGAVRRSGLASQASLKPVGLVLNASGTSLYVLRYAGKQMLPLSVGTVLYLHDIVVAGPQSSATIRISRPPGIARGTQDLLDFYKSFSAKPKRSGVVRQYFVSPAAASSYGTVRVVRSGINIAITLHPRKVARQK